MPCQPTCATCHGSLRLCKVLGVAASWRRLGEASNAIFSLSCLLLCSAALHFDLSIKGKVYLWISDFNSMAQAEASQIHTRKTPPPIRLKLYELLRQDTKSNVVRSSPLRGTGCWPIGKEDPPHCALVCQHSLPIAQLQLRQGGRGAAGNALLQQVVDIGSSRSARDAMPCGYPLPALANRRGHLHFFRATTCAASIIMINKFRGCCWCSTAIFCGLLCVLCSARDQFDRRLSAMGRFRSTSTEFLCFSSFWLSCWGDISFYFSGTRRLSFHFTLIFYVFEVFNLITCQVIINNLIIQQRKLGQRHSRLRISHESSAQWESSFQIVLSQKTTASSVMNNRKLFMKMEERLFINALRSQQTLTVEICETSCGWCRRELSRGGSKSPAPIHLQLK